ncbi:MAG: 6-phospho-beta-glucosidase [Anaerolineae bacterium]|nr:6-phospho-beta-glucosidase [Anaerolineae bacterium]
MKLAVIGGGSTYTPELVKGLTERVDALPVTELALMDIDPQRLEIVGGFAGRMVEATGGPFLVTLHTDLPTAVADATFVITQFRVGQMNARRADERLGIRHGLVGQETTGVGGFAKALRTIPVMLEVARTVAALAPGATLVNFTNPSGLITEALFRHAPEVRAVGLCNAPIGVVMRVAAITGAKPSAVAVDLLGLNHLHWVRGATVDREDVWPAVLKAYRDDYAAQGADAWISPVYLDVSRMVPSSYLRYFYHTAKVIAKQATGAQTRAEQVVEIEKALLDQYGDPGRSAPPPELEKRGGAYYSTAAAALMEAIHNDRDEVHVVNVRHGGAVAGWPADWVLELPCRIDREGAHPIPTEPLPPQCAGLLHQVKSYELLTVEAAVTGDRDTAIMALLANPLGPDLDHVEAVLDDLLRVHAAYLPQFA